MRHSYRGLARDERALPMPFMCRAPNPCCGARLPQRSASIHHLTLCTRHLRSSCPSVYNMPIRTIYRNLKAEAHAESGGRSSRAPKILQTDPYVPSLAERCVAVAFESFELIRKTSAIPSRSGYYYLVRIKGDGARIVSQPDPSLANARRVAISNMPVIVAVKASGDYAALAVKIQQEHRRRTLEHASFWGTKLEVDNIMNFSQYGGEIPSCIYVQLHPDGWRSPPQTSKMLRPTNEWILTTRPPPATPKAPPPRGLKRLLHKAGKKEPPRELGFFGQSYVQVMKGDL